MLLRAWRFIGDAGDHFEQVDEVARRWPDKELLFTEGCVEYTRGEDRKATQERKAEQYAHAVIGSLNAGAAGFIDWNLLLNEKGGPNHARNFCEAPLMYDATSASWWRIGRSSICALLAFRAGSSVAS